MFILGWIGIALALTASVGFFCPDTQMIFIGVCGWLSCRAYDFMTEDEPRNDFFADVVHVAKALNMIAVLFGAGYWYYLHFYENWGWAPAALAVLAVLLVLVIRGNKDHPTPRWIKFLFGVMLLFTTVSLTCHTEPITWGSGNVEMNWLFAPGLICAVGALLYTDCTFLVPYPGDTGWKGSAFGKVLMLLPMAIYTACLARLAFLYIYYRPEQNCLSYEMKMAVGLLVYVFAVREYIGTISWNTPFMRPVIMCIYSSAMVALLIYTGRLPPEVSETGNAGRGWFSLSGAMICLVCAHLCNGLMGEQQSELKPSAAKIYLVFYWLNLLTLFGCCACFNVYFMKSVFFTEDSWYLSALFYLGNELILGIILFHFRANKRYDIRNYFRESKA